MTIKDVAAHCGVAVSTVSRVLNNHPDVSDATRERVMAAVRELNYVPNNAARDLVATQADTIGLVVRGAENPFYTPIIHSIEETCIAAKYALVLHQLSVQSDEVGEAAALARTKRLRGIIFLGGRFDYTQEEGARVGVPFVCCTNTNDFGELSKDAFSSVSIDDLAEARRATRMLIEKGHRRIAIVIDSEHDRSISQLRLQGYREALEEAGIAYDQELVLQTIDFTMEAAYRKTAELCARGIDFTALFVVADSLAIAVLRALHDAGLSVPGDVSLVSIDGIEMSLYSIPTLTTLVQPQETLGRQAAQILIDVLEGRGENRHLRLPTTLRVGGTLAQAPQPR